MAQVQQRTVVKETLTIDKKLTAKALADKIGVPLGSPINGKNVGDTFPVTLTGKVEIREFNNIKGAYFTTKEGYSIKVNASYNPELHKADAVFTAICRELVTTDRNVKFCAFVD